MDNEGQSESSGEFNLYEAADELIAESETDTDSGESAQSEGQPETAPKETEGDNAKTSEDILNEMAKETEQGISPELLSQLNSLGLVHKGMPIEIKDQKQLGELIQKGFDYTQKTMAHAEAVRVETEKIQTEKAQLAQKEQEIASVVTDNKIIEDILADWQSSDPELFAHIQQAYQNKVRQQEQSAPYIKQFESQVGNLRQEIEGLKGQKQTEELGKIRQNFETELSETQEKNAVYLSKLGVKPNWDKVSEKWKADASGTMTMSQALHAVHGEEIIKAHQSQVKNLQTKNKVNSSLLGRNGVSGGMRNAETNGQVKNGDLTSFLREAASTM